MSRLVLSTYGDRCVHCGLAGADTVEHVQPRSLGGTDALENLRPAHGSCNSRRGTDPMPGFRSPPIRVVSSDRW
jgi:5-methylcytosine-specific restriction endonuclease McrA